MNPKTPVSILIAALLLALAAAGPAAGSGAKAGDFRKCGKYDLGFTKAKVKASGMRCKAAKEVFRAWQSEVNCPGNPCEVVEVGGFRCVQSGSDVRVSLRCRNRDTDEAMKAHWGG